MILPLQHAVLPSKTPAVEQSSTPESASERCSNSAAKRFQRNVTTLAFDSLGCSSKLSYEDGVQPAGHSLLATAGEEFTTAVPLSSQNSSGRTRTLQAFPAELSGRGPNFAHAKPNGYSYIKNSAVCAKLEGKNGAQRGTRTLTRLSTRPSSVRVYHSTT